MNDLNVRVEKLVEQRESFSDSAKAICDEIYRVVLARFGIKPEVEHRYIIDVLFPANEVHLVAGPSGTGKTRWLIQMLLKWMAGESVLDYESYPEDFLYVVADRSGADFERTLESMGIPLGEIPTLYALDEGLDTEGALFKRIGEVWPNVRTLIIEDFESYCPAPNGNEPKKRDIARWLKSLTRDRCHKGGYTIFGVVEEPKMKPKDKYPNPRQRIAGFATWGHHVNTIVIIEPENEGDIKDPNRVLIVAPRNAPGIEYQLKFNNQGWLEESDFSFHKASREERFKVWVSSHSDAFGTKDFTDAMKEQHGIPESTSKRWLEKESSEPNGLLSKLDRGVYSIRGSNLN